MPKIAYFALRSLALAACAFSLPAQTSADLSYAKTLHFYLSQDKAHYTLSSAVSIHQTILTQQGTRHASIQIAEQSRTEVSHIQGRFRGRDLPAEAITFRYPHSVGTFTPAARVHEVDPPGEARPGDELNCDYTVSYDDPVYFPLVSIPAVNRVERFALVVDHPRDVTVDFDVYSPGGDLHPVIEHKPEQSSIVFLNLPAPGLLPENPCSDRHAVILTKLKIGDRVITAHTPEAFSRWYREQVDPICALSEPMKALLAPELAAAATPREKARLLFDFVKSQVRYIGDEGRGHAFIPHAPAQVFSQKWGDCKDKAWLLSVLAAQHGLAIHPMLISTEFEPEFADLNLGLFNHVICAMEDDGRMVFMDPTAANSELGDPPDEDLLARGFLLDPKNPRWLRTTDQRTTPTVELQISANTDDPKHGKAKVMLRHGWRSTALRGKKELKAQDLENRLSNGLNRLLAKISLDHFAELSVDREAVTLQADADLSEFLVNSELRAYVPTSPFRVLSRDLLERGKDALPLDANGPDFYKLRVELKCAGLQAKAEEVRLGSPGKAYLQATLATHEDLATLDYSFSQPFHFVPEPERSDLLTFCAQYFQLNRKPFILQRNPR